MNKIVIPMELYEKIYNLLGEFKAKDVHKILTELDNTVEKKVEDTTNGTT